MTEPSAIIAFLEGDGTDGRGRTVLEIVAFNDTRLESNHDFIQWLFPLAEPSGAVADAPVLTPSDIDVIRASDMAQCALAAGTDRMRTFYRTTDHWLIPSDHNHLRITRIIRSLRLLSGDGAADAFQAAILARVEATRAPVSSRSRGYWMTA